MKNKLYKSNICFLQYWKQIGFLKSTKVKLTERSRVVYITVIFSLKSKMYYWLLYRKYTEYMPIQQFNLCNTKCILYLENTVLNNCYPYYNRSVDGSNAHILDMFPGCCGLASGACRRGTLPCASDSFATLALYKFTYLLTYLYTEWRKRLPKCP